MHVSVELWHDWMIGVTLSDLVCQRLIAERRPFLSSRFRKVLFTNEVIQVVEGGFCFPPCPSVRPDRNVLRRLPPLLLRRRWRPRHHSRERLHLCVRDTRDLQAGEHSHQKRYATPGSSLACIPVVFLRLSFPRLTSLPTSPGALSPDSQRPGVC